MVFQSEKRRALALPNSSHHSLSLPGEWCSFSHTAQESPYHTGPPLLHSRKCTIKLQPLWCKNPNLAVLEITTNNGAGGGGVLKDKCLLYKSA